MIGLRPDDDVDGRLTGDDLRAFRLCHATGHHDLRLLPFRGTRKLRLPYATKLGENLLRGPFPDVAGVQDDDIGFRRVVGLDMAARSQEIAHACGVIDIHLTAI